MLINTNSVSAAATCMGVAGSKEDRLVLRGGLWLVVEFPNL